MTVTKESIVDIVADLAAVSANVNQVSVYFATSTTDTTLTEMLKLDSARFVISTGSCRRVSGVIVARDTSTGACHEWEFSVLIKNVGGTTSIVGDPLVSDTFYDSATSTWTFDISADDTNDALAMTVGGETGKTIHWAANLSYTEVL